jgi:hypothetical protein
VDRIRKSGLNLADHAIRFFSFVPDPAGYVTVFHKVDNPFGRCVWHNVPDDLNMLLERESSKGVRHVAVGVNDSYVVILDTGVVVECGPRETEPTTNGGGEEGTCS